MKPTTSQTIGWFAAVQPDGERAQFITRMIVDTKITGTARQATADAALLHLVKYQEAQHDLQGR